MSSSHSPSSHLARSSDLSPVAGVVQLWNDRFPSCMSMLCHGLFEMINSMTFGFSLP